MATKTGALHPRYKGGKKNFGSPAWATHWMWVTKDAARRLGYAGPVLSVDELVEFCAGWNGECQLCGRTPDRTPHIDHDHKTGSVRGIICHRCNLGLGYFKDNPHLLWLASMYLGKSEPNGD